MTGRAGFGEIITSMLISAPYQARWTGWSPVSTSWLARQS